MAAMTSSAHVPPSAEHDAPPVLSSSQTTALDSHINGSALQQNSIDEFPPSATLNGEQIEKELVAPIEASNYGAPSDSTVEPITDVTSGIKPLAPYLSEITTSDHPSLPDAPFLETLPAQEATSSGQVNGDGNYGHELRSDEMVTGDVLQPESFADLPPADRVLSTAPIVAANEEEIIIHQQHPIHLPAEPLSAGAAGPSTDLMMKDSFTVATKVAREREDDEDTEPSAKRTKVEDQTLVANQAEDVQELGEPSAVTLSSSAPAPTEGGMPITANETNASTPAATTTPNQNGTSQPLSLPDFGPMTEVQIRVLLDGMKNIKKSRSAVQFNNPVDAVALGIPHYYDVIKKPMDLRTMEAKLKAREYSSVNEYVADFDIMVQNSFTFNGPQHAVSQQGTNLRATLGAQLKKVPRAGEPAPPELPKKQRKPSVSVPRESKPRATRPSLGPAPPAPTAPEQTFALDHDGMPQIRRHSSMTDGRPKREIHRPPPKDLPYSAKPKKKKYQQELKFCQHVLDEITRPAYQNSIAFAFMTPVDPVALNIPNYRSVIKKPMDLSTVRAKLEKGDYENAKEFEVDVKMIFANCYKFNGKDHPVSKQGAELEAVFDDELKKKSDWLSKHAPVSAQQSPEIDSDPEDSEEEQEDSDAERQEQLKAIHQQFAELSGQLLALQNQPPKRSKSVTKKATKPGKTGTVQARRKSTSLGGSATFPIRSDKKIKAKPKAVKPVTEAQKAEISEKIGLLTPDEMSRAAEIIKRSLRKAGRADLADRGDDEMEFEIDQIPDEALHELLKLVRKAVPPTTNSDENDYRPAPSKSKNAPAANQGKARKNKPMKGAEQEAQIARVKEQLQAFAGGEAMGASAERMKEEQESSGDESDSGSESEEE